MPKADNDPLGRAIADYWSTAKASRLLVLSPMFDEDELPVDLLFRTTAQMSALERVALEQARGRVLDAGAGAGCHALALQRMGRDVTAIDVSPRAVKVMRQRGVQRALVLDLFDVSDQYNTLLMLMNGIGLVGTLSRMPRFFGLLDRILAQGGQVLCDSSDIRYVFEDDQGNLELPPGTGYYGELTYQMQYKRYKGEPFSWLYIDAQTLRQQAADHGYVAQVIAQGSHYDYLARITRVR